MLAPQFGESVNTDEYTAPGILAEQKFRKQNKRRKKFSNNFVSGSLGNGQEMNRMGWGGKLDYLLIADLARISKLWIPTKMKVGNKLRRAELHLNNCCNIHNKFLEKSLLKLNWRFNQFWTECCDLIIQSSHHIRYCHLGARACRGIIYKEHRHYSLSFLMKISILMVIWAAFAEPA